jgi:YHS domain-containing protein
MNRLSYLCNGGERNGLCWHLKAEDKSPARGIAIMTTGPVCGATVDTQETEFKTQFAGKKYFFCSEECRKEFEDRPQDFLEIAA